MTKEAFFSFGEHHHLNTKPFPNLQKKIESYLKTTPDGVVVYCSEANLFPLFMSLRIYSATINGGHPTTSFAIGLFAMDNERFPLNPDEIEAYWDEYKEKEGEFALSEHQVLDRVYESYPGRIRLLLEGTSLDNWEEKNTLQDRADRGSSAVRTAAVGNFAGAIPVFKDSVIALARLSKIREDEFFEHLDDLAIDKSVIAMVIRFGGSHSTMRYKRSEKFTITSEFDETMDGKTHFSPHEALLRKVRLILNEDPDISDEKLEKRITELEWHQSLIGTVVLEMSRVIIEDQQYEYRQRAVKFVKGFLANEVNSLQDTARIEEELRTTDPMSLLSRIATRPMS